MRSDAVAFGIAGVLFGLIAGWVIGAQQATMRPGGPPQQTQAAAPASGSAPSTRAAVLDETKVNALKNVAEREASNATPRIELGNLYFDAERYDDAIKWYGEAVALNPADVNVSTDLGVCYYYTNRADDALKQFEHSLAIDPKHLKTLLNQGIVLAFGKQDLQGAEAAWRKVVEIAPTSDEGRAAQRGLDAVGAFL